MHLASYLLAVVLAAHPMVTAGAEAEAGSQVSSPSLEVPEVAEVRHILPDGVFDDGEWDDAVALPLGGVELLAKRDARYLYLALRFVDGKHSGLDLYLAGSPDVRRHFHISGQLGAASFDGASWDDLSWDVQGWTGNVIGFVTGPEMVIYEPDGFELQFSRAMLAAEGLDGPALRLAFLLKRPELTVPEGVQDAPLDEWVELKLPADTPDER